MKKGSSSMQGQREREEEGVKEEALCWGISSVRITLSSRRVIDTSAASGGPEGKTTPPSSPHSLPCIHPSLLPAPHPSVRCFLSSAGSSAACPGPTVMERGRGHHRHQGGGGGGGGLVLSETPGPVHLSQPHTGQEMEIKCITVKNFQTLFSFWICCS